MSLTTALLLVFIAYAYAGYPLVLLLLKARRRRVAERAPQVRVSAIIAAHNEEEHIEASLRSILASEHPAQSLEVIAVSDGSDDRTEEIARSIASENLRVIAIPERVGKKAALQEGFEHASGEVLVFADASSRFEMDALSKLLMPLADAEVGSVVGRKRVMEAPDSVSQGDGLYWRYEGMVRRLESETGSSWVGVEGGLFAIRRAIFRLDFPAWIAADYGICCRVCEQGFRNIYQPDAIVREPATRGMGGEFRRKVRVIVRGIRAFFHFRRLLSLRRHPMFAFQNLSHRLCRWLVPFALIGLLISTMLHGEVRLLGLQIGFYTLAMVGAAAGGRCRSSRAFSVPLYFSAMNAAALASWLLLFKDFSLWSPPRREAGVPKSRGPGHEHGGDVTFVAAVAAGALFWCLFCLKMLPVPFLWIGAGWATLGLAAAATARRRARMIWYGGALVCLTAFATEMAFWTLEPRSVWQSGSYIRSDPLLGYAPIPGRATRVKGWWRSNLLYDVVYTIDERGLRECREPGSDDGQPAVLFFGCSYTFGYGLKDEECLPCLVSRDAGEHRALNFAFHGYGAHQMLAALRSGLVGKVVRGPVRCAIYQALTEHVQRGVGLSPWEPRGPQFTLDPSGRVRYEGRFGASDPLPFLRSLLVQANKSFAFLRLFSGRWYDDARLRSVGAPDEVRLYVAMVAESARIVRQTYPGAEFHVVLWDETEKEGVRGLIDALEDAGIPVHRMSRILPGVAEMEIGARGLEIRSSSGRAMAEYLLHPLDGHPGPLANRILSDYVCGEILPLK